MAKNTPQRLCTTHLILARAHVSPAPSVLRHPSAGSKYTVSAYKRYVDVFAPFGRKTSASVVTK